MEYKIEQVLITPEKWQEIFKLLSEDFPREAIETTAKEKTKKGYDTAGYNCQYLIDRLNDVVGGDWFPDWNLIQESSYENNNRVTYLITMEVGVTIHGVRRFGFGSGSSVVHADAYKGAFTGGLKKAFSMFKLGNKAYTGELLNSLSSINPPSVTLSASFGKPKLNNVTLSAPKLTA